MIHAVGTCARHACIPKTGEHREQDRRGFDSMAQSSTDVPGPGHHLPHTELAPAGNRKYLENCREMGSRIVVEHHTGGGHIVCSDKRAHGSATLACQLKPSQMAGTQHAKIYKERRCSSTEA